jgi:peptidoglycan/LPS O-acetylase OafA/YrhL
MKRLLYLEGLRGVSAFIVFMAHFKPTFCIDINEQLLDRIGLLGVGERMFAENFLRTFYEGTLPVFIFWFMSAFVISIKMFDRSVNENNRYLVEAASKRYFRFAIPVFVSSLLCFILIKSNLMLNHQLANAAGHGYEDGWLGLWYNFDPGIIHFLKTTIVEVFLTGNCNYNIALWTMTPELMGSMLCFGVFAIAGKNKFRFVIYSAVGLFMIIAGLRDVNYFVYLIFLCGVIWCDSVYSQDKDVLLKEKFKLTFNSKWIAFGLLIISFGATIYSDVFHPIPENLYYFFNYPVKTVALTLSISNFSMMRKFFELRPFRFMGKLSFSFYLLHIPIMFSAGIYMYMYAGITSPYKTLIVFVFLSVLITACSYVFMLLVDKKAIKISDRIGRYFASKN